MSRGRSRSSSGGSSRGSSRSSFSSSSRSYHSPMRGNVVIINRHGGRHSGGSPVTAVIAIGIMFLLFGLIALMLTIPNLWKKQEEYSPTLGTAVSNSIDDGWYYTTYDYYVEGIKYRNMSQEGWEYPETIGRTVPIYYQISNPNIITEELPKKTNTTAPLIAGIALTSIGIFFLIIGISLKKASQHSTAEEVFSMPNSSSNQNTEETKTYCSYCGALIPTNKDKCPNCGAPKK